MRSTGCHEQKGQWLWEAQAYKKSQKFNFEYDKFEIPSDTGTLSPMFKKEVLGLGAKKVIFLEHGDGICGQKELHHRWEE